MIWCMSVPARDTVLPVGICGSSRSEASHGSPSGGQCSTWRKTRHDGGTAHRFDQGAPPLLTVVSELAAGTYRVNHSRLRRMASSTSFGSWIAWWVRG